MAYTSSDDDKKDCVFNYEQVFKDKIEKKIQEIENLCIYMQIPFFATFAVSGDENKTNYKTYRVFTGGNNISLADDRLEMCALIDSGNYTFTEKTAPMTISMDAFSQLVDDEDEAYSDAPVDVE